MRLLHILSLSILMMGSPSLVAHNKLLIKLQKMTDQIGVLKVKLLQEKQAYLITQIKTEIKKIQKNTKRIQGNTRRIQDDTKRIQGNTRRIQDDIKRVQRETMWWKAGFITFVTIGLIGYKTGIISINK